MTTPKCVYYDSLAIIAAFLLIHASAWGGDDKGLTLAKAAYDAATKSLRSGSGRGTYTLYFGEGNNDEESLAFQADTMIKFKDGRYYIKLTYKKHYSNDSVKIIIYDGKSILVNSFAPRFQPFGAEGQILNAPTNEIPHAADVSFNPARFPDCVLPLDPLIANGIQLRFEALANGDYRGTYDAAGCAADFLISKAHGYNAVSHRILSARSKRPGDVFEAQWKKVDNVWVISKWKAKSYTNGKLLNMAVFEYADFKPNAKIEADAFTFKALEVPPGGRILDRRPGHNGVFRAPEGDRTDLGELDGILEYVSSLPFEEAGLGQKGNYWRAASFLVASALGLSGLIMVVKKIRFNAKVSGSQVNKGIDVIAESRQT
jgi:outer membrane lipoprotein-sorting protein